MGTGKSGLYSGTYGSKASPGSTDYMRPDDQFRKNISKRKDKDVNGFYDYIAHGDPNKIELNIGDKKYLVDHRTAARIIKQDKKRTEKSIRLLSCDTGRGDHSFAQNLANKLNVKVMAPTKTLWSLPNGQYFVAGRRKDYPSRPDYNNKGIFKTFYPGGKKK